MTIFKKLSNFVFAVFGVALIAGIILYIAGVIPIFWALAPVWIPIVMLFNVFFIICIFAAIGDDLKSRDPDSCENCVFGKGKELIGHCLGESDGCRFGEICRHYKRI